MFKNKRFKLVVFNTIAIFVLSVIGNLIFGFTPLSHEMISILALTCSWVSEDCN